MAAELIGINRILNYLDDYEFRRLLIQRGANNIHDWRIKHGENKNILVEKLADWLESQPDNNYKEYKIRVFGTYSENPEAKLTEFLNTTFQVYPKPETMVPNYTRPATTGATGINGGAIDVDKYVNVATENATLRAELARMEEKLDELINQDEDDETASNEPETIGAALNVAIMQKLPLIIDTLLIRLAGGAVEAATQTAPGIGSVDPTPSILEEFKKIHPDIEEDLKRLYILATKQPEFFKMLIQNLRGMV